jgi:hypothetical protein
MFSLLGSLIGLQKVYVCFKLFHIIEVSRQYYFAPLNLGPELMDSICDVEVNFREIDITKQGWLFL